MDKGTDGTHNYCRNPDSKEGIWCYTTESGYGFCDPISQVEVCNSECQKNS